MLVNVGTCGWSRIYQGVQPSQRVGKSSLQVYAKLFRAVEINSSFYKFHRFDTYRSWRAQVPRGFRFTIKSHRSLSHEWRLNATTDALGVFQRMVQAALVCQAKAILIQTPSTLTPTEDTLRIVDLFFEKVKEHGVPLAWETRGSGWETKENRLKLSGILEKDCLSHVVDLMKNDPAVISKMAYIRLHGLPGYNLRYAYTNSQLLRLRQRIEKTLAEAKEVYVFFNNYNMYRDAQRFRKMVETGELPPSPFGPRSLRIALEPYENWPVERSRLIEDCGKWYVWLKPDRAIRAAEVLRHLKETEFNSVSELEDDVARFWSDLGLPEAEQVESEYAAR